MILEPQNDMENAGSLQVQHGATLYLNAWLNNSATGALDIGDSSDGATVKIEGWGAQIVGGAVKLSDSPAKSDRKRRRLMSICGAAPRSPATEPSATRTSASRTFPAAWSTQTTAAV